MSDQRFAVDEIELRQSCQQVFAAPVVTVGNVVKVFRSVNMQTTAGFHDFTASGTGIRHGKPAREHRYVLPPDTARLSLSSPHQIKRAKRMFSSTPSCNSLMPVTVDSFKTGHRAQANF